MKVDEYCIAIHKLLIEMKEFNSAKTFENFILDLANPEVSSVYRKILSVYRGMGSFNDLVLYINGVVCRQENDLLVELRRGLHEEITSQMKGK